MRMILLLLGAALLGACTRSAPINTTPVSNPPATISLPNLPTGAAAALTYLPPTRPPGSPLQTPTPNGLTILPTFTPLAQPQPAATPGLLTYTVQPGDYPASIAAQFGISAEDLLAENNLGYDSLIYPGDSLLIPGTSNQNQASAPQNITAAYFKIIPDSELVYGPLSSLLNLSDFIQKQGGYLAYYTQEVEGETLSGAQIVQKVAQNYSVNPRILLALLEYRAQWLSNPNPPNTSLNYPIAYVDDFHEGLYRQLTWSADRLNEGFYRWQEGKISIWTLADGSQITPQPGINPGTAGLQNLFANISNASQWQTDTGANGFILTYSRLFGNPFDWAIEPLLPPGLTQPALRLPFAAGETWQYTGGPHGGWDTGSGWAALDFAPPDGAMGCNPSAAWVRAVAPGTILRSENGSVLQELDNDGLEQTGWVILYLHVATQDKIAAGTRVQTGDAIGHPSCEGGFTIAAHLHIARRYNGIWLAAADPALPLNLGGWVATSDGVEYNGWLTRNGQSIEAWDTQNPAAYITAD